MMNWKQRFSQFFTIVCTSFTVIMLLYAGLAEWMHADLTVPRIFGLCAICAMVAFLVFLTDFIPFKANHTRMAVNFLDVCTAVFGFGGGILKIVPFSLPIVLTVLGMSCAAYAGVIAVMFVNEQIAANDINRKLSEMKRKERIMNNE